ncbi:right-handed parallel beta-helix repeat-containing protein, partial [Candidatus Bathyarchaeota archaeon]|nr:right-handed parallel beta-helix repeat-containing protein [Candidatus Bathyarchaeota archaeon]
MTLRGQDAETTIIDGGGYGEVLKIITDNVSIVNFTIRYGSTGLFISKCGNVNVQNIKVTGNKMGVELSSSSNCTFRNNNITG